MNFVITTLVENTVAQTGKKLIGEHGLSFFIETNNHKILFDTGQNLALSHNAKVLGIPLSQVDTVVLSHGHYDHTGGLQSLLEGRSNFKLFAHPDIFNEKVKETDDDYKYIGIPLKKDLLEKNNVRLRLDKKPVQLTSGVMTTGEIPLNNDFEDVESTFLLKKNNEIITDTLADDQALILETNSGLVVLLGCSHRGVINTLKHVSELTAKNKIYAIMGGLHLGKASGLKLRKIMDHLHEFGLEKIGVGHCTGPRAFIALSNEFKDRVFLNTVGNRVEF